MSATAKVLVVFPPISVARDYIDYPYVSDLGAVQVAAVLAECAETTLIDSFALAGAGLRWREDGRAHLGASLDTVERALARAGEERAPDAVIFAYTPFHRPPVRDDLLASLLGSARARWPAAALWIADCYQSGQHYVDAPPELVLAAYPEAELYVKYECEVTLTELVLGLARGERPRGVVNGVAPPKLDALPFPAWEKVDLAAYERFHASVVAQLGRGPWHFPIDGRTLPMVTSRGCPFTCVHCSSNPGRADGEPKTQRRYSPERLAAYLRELVEKHGATRIEVLDELINVNERHFDSFLDEVSRLRVKFDVPNGMRADYLEPRHFDAMRGLIATASVSAESGVQRVVTEVVKKRLDLAAIVRAARGAHEAGVRLIIHYIIGLPGETAEEVNGTLAFALDLLERYGAEPAVQFATPLPGTELARGRALPVVSDWGPYFQNAPSQPDALVDPRTLRAFMDTLHERLDAEREPTFVLDVTHVCNNGCSFCAVSPPLGAEEHPRDWRAALARGREMRARRLVLDGGEPTLHPELFALLGEARALGYAHIRLETNGRLLAYDAFAKRLLRAGIAELVVSLHGDDAAMHARHVGVDDAFAQTSAGLANALRHAPRDVRVVQAVVVTRENAARLDAIAARAAALGVTALELRALAPFGEATSRWRLSPEAFADAVRPVLVKYERSFAARVVGLPRCYLPGLERFVAPDLDLASTRRHDQGGKLDLTTYRRAHRERRAACGPCAHASFCGGFWLETAAPLPWAARETKLPVVA